MYEESLKSNEHQISSSNFGEFSIFEHSIKIPVVLPISETQDSREKSPSFDFPTIKSLLIKRINLTILRSKLALIMRMFVYFYKNDQEL